MKPESDFAQTMALLAAEHCAVSAPTGLERNVLAEFEAARRRRIRKLAAVGAIAALLVAGAFNLHRPTHAIQRHESRITPVASLVEPAKVRPPEQRRRAPRRSVTPEQAAEAPFIAIPYTVPLAPEERTAVVRMTLSPAAIAAVGFPSQPGIPQLADVLISEDGRARAIRIVANSDYR